jgi:hypothetical protein
MKKLYMLLVTMLIMVIAGCTPGGWGPESAGKSFTEFSFPTSTETTINNDTHTIAVTVPDGTDVTALVATFATTGISVKVVSTTQVSGTTPNDFTNSVIYTVTALNGSTQDYTVTVTVGWTRKADFEGIGRHSAVGFSIGSKGYIGTGYDGSTFYNDFWEYDSATDTWTQKANFGGTARGKAVGFSIGSKGYIGTGYDGTENKNDFWEYHPRSNYWTQKANFEGAARYNAVGFSIGDKGYIGTGAYYGSSTYYKDFWEYNPDSDTWTQKANIELPFIAQRSAAVGFSIGSKGYVGLGTVVYLLWGFIPINIYFSDFYEYDQTANTWTMKKSFSGGARYDAVGFSIGSKGYVGTGYDGSTFYNDFWEYDSVADTWTQKANFGGTARGSAVGFSIGNRGYIGTGSDNLSQFLKDFWEYTPGP